MSSTARITFLVISLSASVTPVVSSNNLLDDVVQPKQTKQQRLVDISPEAAEVLCTEGSDCYDRCNEQLVQASVACFNKPSYSECLSCAQDQELYDQLVSGDVTHTEYANRLCELYPACETICGQVCFDWILVSASCAWQCDSPPVSGGAQDTDESGEEEESVVVEVVGDGDSSGIGEDGDNDPAEEEGGDSTTEDKNNTESTESDKKEDSNNGAGEHAELTGDAAEVTCADGSECASRCRDKIDAFETCLANKEQNQKDSCISCIRDETLLNELAGGATTPEKYVQHVCATSKARGCPSVCNNCFEAAQERARCVWACDLTADDPNSQFSINNEAECGPGSKCEERCKKPFNDFNECIDGMSDGELAQCLPCVEDLSTDKVGQAFADHVCANGKGCLSVCDKCSAQFSEVSQCTFNCDFGSQPQKTDAQPASSKRKFTYKNLLLELQNAPVLETDAEISAWVQVTELFYISYYNNKNNNNNIDAQDSETVSLEKRQHQLQFLENFGTKITFHNQSALVYYTGKRVNRFSYSQTVEYSILVPEGLLLQSSSDANSSATTEIAPDEVLMQPFMDGNENNNLANYYVEQLKEQIPAFAESDIVVAAPVISEPAVASSSLPVQLNKKCLTIVGGMMVVSAFAFGFS